MLKPHRPLAGMRILVTRPRKGAEQLAEALRQEGAKPWELPLIEIAPPFDWIAVDPALRGLESFDWVIFTSANGVLFFFSRLQELGLTGPLPSRLRWAAIGPATAQALGKRGVKPDFIPKRYVAEAILEEIGEVRGKRILLPRAQGARPFLGTGLQDKGAEVEEVAIYRTLDTNKGSLLGPALEKGEIDLITLTSPSAVRSLISGIEPGLFPALVRVPVACIGPVTAQAAQHAGLQVKVVAKEHTIEGLVQALLSSLAKAG